MSWWADVITEAVGRSQQEEMGGQKQRSEGHALWTEEEGAERLRMPAASRSQKSQQNRFCPRASRKENSLLTPGFQLMRPVLDE